MPECARGERPSGILGGFGSMRWLMVCLLASLAALLTAAAAMARHIRVQHAKLKAEPSSHIESVHETDLESKRKPL
jgi:hypothetical protein